MPSSKIDIRDSLAYDIARYARLQRRGFSDFACDLGLDLSQEQWFILNRLHVEGSQPQSELSNAIFADRPNLTRILQTLLKKRLVSRKEDPKDARCYIISLTRRGRAAHERLAAAVVEERRRLFADISSEQLAQVRDTLALLENRLLEATAGAG